MEMSTRGLKRGRSRRCAPVLIALLPLALACSCGSPGRPGLTVYTYDSFVSEWGPGPRIATLFEKSTGIKVSLVSKGDAGQLLSSLLLEKDKPRADLAIGIDNLLAPKALAAGLFSPYRPAPAADIPPELILDKDWRLSPYDYGHFAIIWDSERLAAPPASLEELTLPKYARKLIIMDPRTSTPGLGLLAWSQAVYGQQWRGFWKRLRPSVLAMTPGWDSGYGLFTKGEAPLVLSYATSPAYHKEAERSERYKALSFPEGHVMQIEGAGILAGAARRRDAEKFMDFLLSPACQSELPATQWMYPANPKASLPASFSAALRPALTLALDPARPAADAVEAAEILSAER